MEIEAGRGSPGRNQRCWLSLYHVSIVMFEGPGEFWCDVLLSFNVLILVTRLLIEPVVDEKAFVI